MQHFSVGLASDVDIFLNLGGETVTSITTEKTATAKKTQAACDSPGREKKADWMLSYRDEYNKARKSTALLAKYITRGKDVRNKTGH